MGKAHKAVSGRSPDPVIVYYDRAGKALYGRRAAEDSFSNVSNGTYTADPKTSIPYNILYLYLYSNVVFSSVWKFCNQNIVFSL